MANYNGFIMTSQPESDLVSFLAVSRETPLPMPDIIDGLTDHIAAIPIGMVFSSKEGVAFEVLPQLKIRISFGDHTEIWQRNFQLKPGKNGHQPITT